LHNPAHSVQELRSFGWYASGEKPAGLIHSLPQAIPRRRCTPRLMQTLPHDCLPTARSFERLMLPEAVGLGHYQIQTVITPLRMVLLARETVQFGRRLLIVP
jgi:hypothetical protein